MPTRIDIIDAALLRIGAEPLQSEAAAGADAHLRVYDSILAYLLAANPWHFNTVTRKLARRTAAPDQHWAYQFDLPPDMVGAPRAAYDSGTLRTPFTRFELDDNVLKTDAAEIWLKFDKRPDPMRWPGYFVELVTVAVMAELALSVREDGTLRDRLLQQCWGTPGEGRMGGLMGVAMNLDSQGKPSPVLNMGSSPFTSARFER